MHITSELQGILLSQKDHCAFKRGQYPQETAHHPAGIFHFRFVFTVAGGEECYLSLSAKFTQQCPDVQLSHFICLSLGFLKWCEKVEFHVTYSKSWLICWHSPSCPGGNCETFQNALVRRARGVRGAGATKVNPLEAYGAEKGLLFDFWNKSSQKRNPRASLHNQMASLLPEPGSDGSCLMQNHGTRWRWVDQPAFVEADLEFQCMVHCARLLASSMVHMSP